MSLITAVAGPVNAGKLREAGWVGEGDVAQARGVRGCTVSVVDLDVEVGLDGLGVFCVAAGIQGEGLVVDVREHVGDPSRAFCEVW